MERIEDEYDLRAYQKAMENFRKDPTTYSLDEVERELGLKMIYHVDFTKDALKFLKELDKHTALFLTAWHP